MTRNWFLACLPVIGLSMAACPAIAQQPTPPQTGAPMTMGPPQAGIAAEAGEVPVFGVTQLEVLQSSKITGVTMIVVKGLVSSEGWGEPTLIPLVRGNPPDGILDLVLVAEPPTETMPATGFVPVEATLHVEASHPYRGVRVRSAHNVVVLRQLPGSTEVPPPSGDCGACVGHKLVTTGAPAAAGDIVPGKLPPVTRILKPEDGIANLTPNPNRLTLLLGDDGRITEAVWQ
jgi:hypothetical protein